MKLSFRHKINGMALIWLQLITAVAIGHKTKSPLELELTSQILNHSNQVLRNPTIIQEPGNITFKEPKDWTIIIYMAADNDLANFARKNLMQLATIGSNDRVNILVQLDTTIQRQKKVTLRYFIEENKLTITNYNDPASQQMDSGSPHTLIDCCRWAMENFPAKNYMLDLWNHGIGIIDIERRRMLNPSELFTFNPQNCMVESRNSKRLYHIKNTNIHQTIGRAHV